VVSHVVHREQPGTFVSHLTTGRSSDQPCSRAGSTPVSRKPREVALACWHFMRHGLLTRKKDPMARLFVRSSVADYILWRQVYDDLDEER
jgi:hypothetical protein